MSKHVCVFITGLSPRKVMERGEAAFACDDEFDPESFFSSEQLKVFRELVKEAGWTGFTITGFQCI